MTRRNSIRGSKAFRAFAIILSYSGILWADHANEHFVWDSPIQLVYDFSEDYRSGYVPPELDDHNEVLAYVEPAAIRREAASQEDLSQAQSIADFIKYLTN